MGELDTTDVVEADFLMGLEADAVAGSHTANPTVLMYIFMVAPLLSIFGTLLVTVSYCLMPTLRRHPFRLMFWLIVSCGCLALKYLTAACLSYEQIDSQEGAPCTFLALYTQFFVSNLVSSSSQMYVFAIVSC